MRCREGRRFEAGGEFKGDAFCRAMEMDGAFVFGERGVERGTCRCVRGRGAGVQQLKMESDGGGIERRRGEFETITVVDERAGGNSDITAGNGSGGGSFPLYREIANRAKAGRTRTLPLPAARVKVKLSEPLSVTLAPGAVTSMERASCPTSKVPLAGRSRWSW